MKVKLIAVVLALAGAFAYSKLTHRARLQEALRAPSQFGEINAARDDGKPLLMSVLLPGCPWAAHANDLLAGAKDVFGDRYHYLQVSGAGITTNGKEPFDYLASKCTGGLCLFHPKSGRVEQLDEMLPAEQLKTAMTAFAGG